MKNSNTKISHSKIRFDNLIRKINKKVFFLVGKFNKILPIITKID